MVKQAVRTRASYIYITDSLLKFAALSINRLGRPQIDEHEINIGSLSGTEISAALRSLLKEKKISAEHLTLIIPRTKASIRSLEFPSSSESELRKMAEYEMVNLFPYKPEEMVFDIILLGQMREGYSHLRLVAAQKEIVCKYLTILKSAGLAPDKIEISSVSLFNQLASNESGNCLLVNIEENFADVLYATEKKFSFSRGIKFNKDVELIKELKATLTILKDKGISIDKIILSGKSLDLGELGAAAEVNQDYSVTKGLLTLNNRNALKIDLLPDEARLQKGKEVKYRSLVYSGVLIILNLTLIGNIVFLNIKARQEYVNYLKTEIKQLDKTTSLLQKKTRKIEVLNNYLNSTKFSLGLLSVLYRIAPEGLYLTTLDIYGHTPNGVIVLLGQAKDPERVLKFANTLKGTGIVKKAEVNYITKRNVAAQQAVDFEIKSQF